jgi:hypothetical protein
VALFCEAGCQVLVIGRQAERSSQFPPCCFDVRALTRARLTPQDPRAQRAASVGSLLALQPIEVAGVLAQTKRALLVAERSLDLALRECHLPHPPSTRVYSVHHEMKVSVAAVPVRYHHRMVFGEAEVQQQLVRHHHHRFSLNGVVEIEADRKVVDRLCRGRG